MALSEAIRNRIRQNVENKVGVGSESAEPSTTQSSSGLSSAMQERIRKNVTMKRLGREDTGVDEDFINKFMNDYKLFSYKSQYDWSNMSYRNGMDSDAAAKRAEKERDLAERATAIRTYLDINKGSVDPGAFQELTSYLDQFDINRAGVMHGFSAMQKYYSQWDSEDAYEEYMFQSDPDNVGGRQKRYQDNQAKIEALKEEKRKAGLWDKKEIQNQIDALEAENRNYERGNENYVSKAVDEYSRTADQVDFDKYSANRNFDTPTREELTKYDVMNDTSSWYFDANGVYRDAFGNELKAGEDGNWYNPNAKQPVVDRLGMFMNASEDELQEAIGESVGAESGWATVLKDGVDGSWDQLTEKEVDIYYYLLNKSGQETADKYLADMKTELNRRATNAYNQQLVKGFDEANALERLAMSVATTPAQLFSGVAGTIENAANTLMGNEINPYSAANSGMHFSQTVRGEQAAAWDETGIRIPGIDFTLGDAYQAGMSILDSYAAIGIGGGMGGALLASSAAQSEATKLYEQGASIAQIALGSAAAGAAEMVFESVSIDKLINMKDAKTVGQMVKNALIQGGIEASEEGFTEIANIVTNAIIMGGQSDWQKLVEENGGNKWKAFLAEVQTVAHSSLAGFLSGTGSATGPSAVSYAATQNQYADAGKMVKEYDQGVDVLMQLANEVAGVSKGTQKSLDKQISKVGKNASNVRVGRLYDTVSTAYSEQNQGDIAKSLERKGYSAKEASAIAEALAAESNGQQLTGKQEQLLNKAKSDSRVQDAITNIVENKKSTMGQRDATLGGFTTQVAFNHMAKEYAKAQEKAARTNPAGQGQENAAAAGKVDAQNKEAAQSRYEVSAEGKSIQVSTGKTVNITGIASVEKGKLVLQTEDGTVDAADVAYASQDEALVYEAVASLGGIIDADSATKLVKKFNPADGVSAAVYAKGITQAYTYGYYGYAMAEATGADTMSGALTESQRNTAFAFGRVQRKNDGAKAQEQVSKYHEAGKTTAVQKKGGVYFRNNNMETSDIASHLESSGVVLNDQQAVGIETMQHMSEALGVEFYVFESYVKDGKRYYIDEDGVEQAGAPNGWYDTKTGRIYIDLHAGVTGKGTMLFTIAHELTHFIHQWSPAKFQKLADIIFTHGKMQGQVAGQVAAKMAKAKTRGKPISYEVAYEEVVADGMESILKSGRVMEMMADVKQQDRGMWQKICDWFKDLVKYMKRVVDAYRGLDPDSVEGKYVADMKGLIKEIEAVYAEGLVEASENYQSFMSMATSEEIMAVENGTMFSYSSLAEAAGFTAVENADGTRAFTRDGAKVSEVTVADIENSPIGAFINYSVEKKDISADDAKRQKEMFASICTMACKTNDFAMTMQFVGSAVFTGMKANADKQYGTTYDFPSICTKTQAVIDAMSAKMVKLGRGLKSDEIVQLYREVFASGNPVPCPECYVFSRWIGIGGLLDNIKKYQDYYGNMKTEDVAAAYLKMKAEVAKVAEEQGITFGKAKGALTSKITKEYNKLTEKIEKAQNQGEKVKPADLKRLAELEPMMNTVKGMTWLENVYFADSSLKKVNPKFRVPNEVLFDLNNGEAFAAKYKEAWAFRTTQGAGYGKAITPYAEAKLGEGVLVTNNTTKTIKSKANDSLDNFFLQQKGKLDKKAREALDRARVKQKIQAFIGGQRFQSTSDARYENASDYLLAALEMQAMGGMVQVYTKVDGAVPAFSSWGFSINQSLMPLGGGLDADGNVVDTPVGGMSPKVAFKNRDKHETAGTITIGVNDNHIRAMFQQWVRDFIIPYHASGGKADVVAELRRIQEGDEKKGKMVRSTDYSRTQGDKALSDEVLRWQGKSAEEIQRIHAIRDARIAILTGGSPNMEVVHSNRFLSALYDKLQGEWKGVKLAKSKVESQIFPNEFWDQSVGYENSGKITRDYLEYCDDLGFLHRFSGMVPSNGKLVPVNGYDQNGERVQLTDLAYKYENGQKTDQVEEFFWKVLTDRRMYDNEGNYLPQKVVTLNDTTTDTVTDFAKNNFGRQYSKEASDQVVNKILYSDRIDDLTEDEVYRLIENSNHGEYAMDTFVPVRRDTPPLLVALSKEEGRPPVKNLPIIMKVEHIQQCMDEEVAANDGKRGHALTADNIIEIIKALDDPRYVFLQEDNRRYCEVVEYSVGNRGEKAFAIVTYTGNKNQDLMNGFPGREYNILVTAYPPSSDQWKKYQKSPNNKLIYDKTKDAPQGSYGSHVPSLLSGSPFATKIAQPEKEVNSELNRDSLTPEQQKHFDYNQKQKTVGAALKTLKGSAIKRSTKFGVGKEIGGEIYFQKDYAEDIMPPEILSQAMQLLEENQPGFEYNCLKFNSKTGVVAFQEAPDFDTAREPMVGDYVSVNTNTGVVKTGHSNYIWHHKWNWVKNDYSGFDVAKSWNWSKQWLSTLTEVSDGNGIDRWNAQLDRFNLPHDGKMFSEREQEYDSKDTSVKILPATFTKFGLKATDRVLDWGGGQYDIAKKAVELGYPGIKFEVVDAFNRTKTHNDRILDEYKENPATVLTINNVLNVIKETEIIEDVIRESKEYLAADGVCYIKIYEGNDVDGKTGNGKVTSSGWQNNQPAEWYKQFAEKYYQHVERVGDILVASDSPIDKKALPKVSKETAGVMRAKVKEIAKAEPSMRDSLYSERDEAPVFYSQMAKVVEGIKQEKFGASTVISMLRGRGIKAEEIRWSGIQAFLEGKKSVTKAELLEFIAGSMLQIEEETLSDQEIPYSQEELDQIAKFEAERDTIAEELKAEWKRIVGTDIPIMHFGTGLEHAVVNKLMEANATKKGETEIGYKYKAAKAALQRCIEYSDDYYGYDNARQAFREAVRNPQDFMNSYELTSFEKGVFRDFIKAQEAYRKADGGIPLQDQRALIAIAASADRYNSRISKIKTAHYTKAAKHFTKWGQYKIKGGSNYRELLFKIPGSDYFNDAMETHWEREGVLAHARIQDLNTFLGKMLFIEEIQSDWHNDGHKDGYASEEAAVRKRVDDLAKQWDDLMDESMTASATRSYAINEKMDAISADKERIENKLRFGRLAPDAPFSENYHEYVLKRLIRMAAEQDYDSIGWTPAQIQVDRWSEKFAEGYRIEYDQEIPKFLRKYGKQWDTTVGKTVLDSGIEVWSMAITDSMKESVLTKGQPLYSDRDYVAYDRTAILKESKVDEYLNDYAAKSSPKYAQAYITYMQPSTFLQLTTDDWIERDLISEQAGELDEERLSDSRPGIYLRIDHETGQVTGHEGRHRMSAMDKAGIYYVPVLLLDTSNKMTKTDIDELVLHGQFDKYARGTVNDAIPLSYENRGRVIEKFATQSSRQRVGERIGYNKTLRFQDRAEESVSNRSLLANALETAAQNEIERNKIQEYKGKISLIDSEEKKLHELNEQIKELSFAKGPRDTQKIRDLQFEAKQTANRISTYDKQLLRLEASKPLQDVLTREKKMAYQRAEKKGKDALAAYKEKAAKTQRALLDKWQESRKKGIESREKTAMRHKIQNVVSELNTLLLSNDKKRHVPENMKKAVAEALKLVNMDTVGAEERAAKYAALIAKETDPDKIDAYTATMENILRQGEKMGQRLKELRDAYEEIAESDDPDIANAYDPVIAGSLKELAQSIGDTSLRNMTIEQLSDVYDMYRMVLTRVRDANKTFLKDKKESISNLASRVVGEVRRVGGDHKYRAAVLDALKKFGWNNLKPVYAFEHLGSQTLTEVFNSVRAGEDVWAVDVTEAREYYLDKSRKYGYDSWDFKKKYRFESTAGQEFELTLEQILSLYAYSKREQAHDHLRLGGFVFDSNIETYTEKGSKLIKYKVNTADAHQISVDNLAKITGTLTKDQMAFVDEMQDYLSTVMGAKGNEITMQMYGVKLFKEKFYFPLKSAKQFMFEQNEVSGEVRIKNSGFTNKVVAKANNPVILSNFMDVWAGHVNDMSMYHAFVLPLEDFNRIFNYNSPKKEGQPPVSVKGTIQNAYSPAAVNYVKQLITDLNGGARTDPTTGFISKMMGLFKKGSVFASLSVVVQQPSAVARAAALVDTKYFIGPKVDHKRHKALWEEVKKYAPVAIIKEMGYFDTNMGKSTQDFIQGKEYDGFADKMKALVVDSGYRDEILSKAPALADEIAWCSIWEAVKRETKAKYPGLDAKAEPFLKLCGSRFTEVITKTQVYDSVLSRSAHMRSKDTGMKMATAFMAEPTTSINMIYDALLQGKRGNRKYAGKAIGAVIASQIINSILVSFVYAGRDDDEGETYWEKYIGTLTGEVLDSLNPAGYIPFIKDILSIVQGYDVERSDMAVISDLWNAIQSLKKDNVSAYRKVEGFAGSIAQIFGLPVKNIMRDARGIYQTIMSFVNGQQTTAAGIGTSVKESLPKWMGGGEISNQDQLYQAYLSGDKTQIARVESRYKDRSSIDSAIRKALRENDPRIHEAAIAWNANDLDEYMRIAKQILAEKHFTQDNVVMAIRAEANELAPEEEKASSSKAKGLFTVEKFAEAIAQGDQAMANAVKVDIIQMEQKNGKSAEEAEKSFNSSAKSELKEMFLAGELSNQEAIDALVDYCGADAQDATADVQYWEFKQDYPDVYADDAWFDKYYKEVESSGISIDVYMDYRNQVKSITGDDKKERRMAIIHSLPITSAQKDALYYAEGWAASKINEAPWH